MSRVTRTRGNGARNAQVRAREGLAFHGRFYGLRNFRCKNPQLCATRRELASLWPALKNTLRNIAKSCAKSPL